MKEVTIKSKVVSRDGTGSPVSGGSASSVDMSAYLLKKIWEKVFEIKTAEDGTEYLFAKLHLAAQCGITMYVDGGELDLPSIYDGIPFDNKTIWLNPDTGVVEVLETGKVEYPLNWEGFSSGSWDGTASATIKIPSKTSELDNDKEFVEKTAVTENVLIDSETLELNEDGAISVKSGAGGSNVVITNSLPADYEEDTLYVITG